MKSYGKVQVFSSSKVSSRKKPLVCYLGTWLELYLLWIPDLKQLIVSVDLANLDGWEELPEEPPFISMVSLWYALQMMPNLEARFVYEPLSKSSCFDEENRDKTG